MAVDLLLDNPQIALRQVGNGDPTVTRAPGASDLADLGRGLLPRLPRRLAPSPGASTSRTTTASTPGSRRSSTPTSPSRPTDPDLLAVQYWLYWYYNDWNNKHEGDWEFVQLLFPASTVAEALADRAGQRRLRPARGRRARRLGRRQARARRAPTPSSTRRSAPTPATSPPPSTWGAAAPRASAATTPRSPRPGSSRTSSCSRTRVDDPSDPLAWVGFEGRWGERHAAPNNGPTGPNTKPQWTEPVTWHDGLRDSSFVVPTGDTRGTQLIDTFCGVVEWGSVQFIRFVASPARVLFVLAVLAALAVFLVRRTSWRSVEPAPAAAPAPSRRDRPCRRRALPAPSRDVRRRRGDRRPGRRRSRSSPARSIKRLPFIGDLVDRLGHRGHRRPARHRLDHRGAVRPPRLRR